MAEGETREVEPVPSQQVDPLLYRIVVCILGASVLLVVIGGLVLSGMAVEVPAALVAIGAACSGYLGGLLTPRPES